MATDPVPAPPDESGRRLRVDLLNEQDDTGVCWIYQYAPGQWAWMLFLHRSTTPAGYAGWFQSPESALEDYERSAAVTARVVVDPFHCYRVGAMQRAHA